MDIDKYHDKFFKETISNVDVAKDFLNNYLPESILPIVDVDSLELQSGSFIDKTLKENFTDMLFKASINNKDGYIYFLLEHKSYTYKTIAFQLLKYIAQIWHHKVDKENVDINNLPIILPLVIYHGRDEWKIKTNICDMIGGYSELPEEVKALIPNFQYVLYNISNYTNEEIKGEVQLRIMLEIFRDIFTKDKKIIYDTIIRSIKCLSELEDRATGLEYFETFMRYIFNARKDMDESDYNEINEEITISYPEGSEKLMTLAEIFMEKGMEKGMKEGMKEGIQKGESTTLIKTATKLLTQKFGPIPKSVIEKIQSSDTKTLEGIIEGIFTYQSLDDVKKHLN